jgi:hypothetical protein
MDEDSSAPSLPFQSPATPVSAPMQTTYTTAGTIYNPSSSQRLQPPARRGRLLKATSEFDNLKFVNPPLPRHQPDALHRLYMSESLAQTQPPPDQQISYEPLQQNYDRAVSPVNGQDQAHGMSWSMGMQSSAPLFDVKGKGIAVDANSSDPYEHARQVSPEFGLVPESEPKERSEGAPSRDKAKGEQHFERAAKTGYTINVSQCQPGWRRRFSK